MLALPVELTHEQAGAVALQLQQAIVKSTEAGVSIDASALKKFDSAALAVLIDARRASAACGKTLVVRGVSPQLQSLAQVYGVAELISLA